MAAFINAGTNSVQTATAATHMLTIGNDSGQTCAVSQLDDDNFLISTQTTNTNTGITIFGGTNGGSIPPMTVDTPRIDPRILNQYLSASDLLEKFIADIGARGIKEGEVLNVPIELFINWLVCKAAEEDGHAPPEGLKQLPSNVVPIRGDRCRCCGQFITAHRRKAGVLFCSDAHMDQYLAKTA